MATSTIVGLAFLLLLVAVAFAFAWQERRSDHDVAVIYGVEDALEFVMLTLSERTRSQLARSDVRRILEWEMLYLQTVEHPPGAPVVVGGVEAAEFAQRKALQQGHGYNAEAIIEVLDRQADYLNALGAVGRPVAPDEIDGIAGGPGEQVARDESEAPRE